LRWTEEWEEGASPPVFPSTGGWSAFFNPSARMNLMSHLHSILVVAAWALIGSILLIVGVKLIDLLTPGKLEEHVFKDQNVAAAVVYGCALIAIAIIIASAMH